MSAYNRTITILKTVEHDTTLLDAQKILIYPGGDDKSERKNILDIISETTDDIITVVNDHSNAITTNSNTLSEHEERISELEDTINDASIGGTDINQLKETVDDLSETVSNLSGTVSNLSGTVDDLSGTAEILQGAVNSHESTLTLLGNIGDYIDASGTMVTFVNTLGDLSLSSWLRKQRVPLRYINTNGDTNNAGFGDIILGEDDKTTRINLNSLKSIENNYFANNCTIKGDVILYLNSLEAITNKLFNNLRLSEGATLTFELIMLSKSTLNKNLAETITGNRDNITISSPDN